MEFIKSIFSQIRKDYHMPQTSETKDLEANNKDLDTSLNGTQKEVKKENPSSYETSDTIDYGDKFVPNFNSIYTDTDYENTKHGLETVLSPEDQNIKASEKARIFTYHVDVEYVNDRVDLPAVTLDESLFIPFDNISNSLKETEPNQTQTEVGIIGVDNYKTYAENIKKVEITDDMTEYTSMTEYIVDLDEFKEFLNFDNDSETTFINKIKDVEDVIESFTITNESFKTKEISDNVSSKDLEAQNIGDTYNDVSEKNLDENLISDIESIISISSDDELNDLKLTLSLSDFETISISSLDTVLTDKNAIVKYLEDKQTVTQLESFNNAMNELTHESVKENCNLINNKAIVSLDDSDSCSGYHSSDFEFITEDEAKETNKLTFETCKTVEISIDIDTSECKETKEGASTKNYNSSTSYDYRNAAARYYNNNFRRQNMRDYSYRQNHFIPEGDNYLNLFEGMFEPRVTCMMENKMTEPSSIYVQYEGIGFDMRAFNDHDSDAEFEEEAIQSARKILKTYPDDNRKRRRF